MKHRKEAGSLLDFPGATNLNTREEALELECDILIPAASAASAASAQCFGTGFEIANCFKREEKGDQL